MRTAAFLGLGLLLFGACISARGRSATLREHVLEAQAASAVASHRALELMALWLREAA